MHTKGQWTAEWDKYGGYDCMWGAYIIKDMNGKEIATLEDTNRKISIATYNDEYTPPQDLTDKARLITAAPELLEELNNLVGVIGILKKMVGERANGIDLTFAEQLIVKVKGDNNE